MAYRTGPLLFTAIKTMSLLLAIYCFGCRTEPPSPVQRYLFLGHPYDWYRPDGVDPRLEQLDYSKYQGIWLGGDVYSNTAEKPENMTTLDQLFGFDRVRWALGNHDLNYGDPENVLNQLPHPPFFTEWRDGFCLTVLNTNLLWPYPAPIPQENCAQKEAQHQMLQTVTDTMQRATHWVILHHYELFADLKSDSNGQLLDHFNVRPIPLHPTCDSTLTVTKDWYLLLQQVQSRGTQVVTIGGDVGMRAKRSEYQTQDGIWMLGSGINNSVPREYAPEYVTDFGPDELLEVTYRGGELDWEFVLLGGD